MNNDITAGLRTEIASLRDRLDCQQTTLSNLANAVGYQNIVLRSVLEYHEDRTDPSKGEARIPGDLLAVMREAFTAGEESTVKARAALRPAPGELLDRTVAHALAHLRPDAA